MTPHTPPGGRPTAPTADAGAGPAAASHPGTPGPAGPGPDPSDTPPALEPPAARRVVRRRPSLVVAVLVLLVGLVASAVVYGGPGVPAQYAVSSLALTLLLTWLLWPLATGPARARARVVAATAELRAQADMLEAIVDGAAEGVTVWDEHSGIVLRNAVAVAQLGEPPYAGRDGMYLADRVTPCPLERTPVALARSGHPVSGAEYFLRNEAHPEGLVLTASCRRIRLADGRDVTVLITRDVTADRARESELVAFAGMVAHDLKAPLSTIAGFAEVLAGRLATGTLDPGALGRTVDRIHATSRQMITLVNDLLDHAMARDAVPDSRVVDLAALLTAVLDQRIGDLGSLSELGPEIFIGDLPPVSGDPAMLRRLLDNLLGNALSYARPGRPAHIDVTAAVVGDGWVRVEVADRGPGIPDADKQRAFQPFQRLRGERDHGGTGLGLAICRRIVERHGGAITVVDNTGGGARFRFTLPGPPALSGAAPALNGAGPGGEGPTSRSGQPGAGSPTTDSDDQPQVGERRPGGRGRAGPGPPPAG